MLSGAMTTTRGCRMAGMGALHAAREVAPRSGSRRRALKPSIVKPLARMTMASVTAIVALGLGATRTAAAAPLHSGEPCKTAMFCEINPVAGYSTAEEEGFPQGFNFGADAGDKLTVRITVGAISACTVPQGCDVIVELGLGLRPHITILDRQIPSSTTATASYTFTRSFGKGFVALAIRDVGEGPYDLTVTLNRAPACVVPKLAGQTLAQARAKLKNADCSLGRVTTTRSHRAQPVVVGQEPAAHKTLPAGAKVRLRLG
jgi:PASTA domain